MDIYKLSYDELLEKRSEFNKTAFGRIAWFFSCYTGFLGVFCFFFFLIANVICNIFNENELVSFPFLLFFCCIFYSLFVITQLQYMNMFKDYIKTRKDK